MTKLQTILKEKNITQRALYNLIAEKCSTPIGYDRISKIVNGKVNNYSVYTLLKLCIALDVTPNQLVEREPFMSEECI